jgi:hypothetical protein
MLCSLIGREVESTAESTESGLVVRLGSTSLVLSPSIDELRGPEIAMLHDLRGDEDVTVVWRPGEDVFRHIS